MEIKIGDRTFEVPEFCPTDAFNKRELLQHLRDHGPESLLASRKLAPYAQCIWNEVLEAGVQPVEPGNEPQQSAPDPTPTQETGGSDARDKPAESDPKS